VASCVCLLAVVVFHFIDHPKNTECTRRSNRNTIIKKRKRERKNRKKEKEKERKMKEKEK